jgi:hypothetical protein
MSKGIKIDFGNGGFTYDVYTSLSRTSWSDIPYISGFTGQTLTINTDLLGYTGITDTVLYVKTTCPHCKPQIVKVKLEPEPISLTGSTVNGTCENCGDIDEPECNGAITLYVCGGVRPFTYQWSGATKSGKVITSTTKDLGYLEEGNYNVIVSDSYGITGTTGFTIDVAPCNPPINLTAVAPIISTPTPTPTPSPTPTPTNTSTPTPTPSPTPTPTPTATDNDGSILLVSSSSRSSACNEYETGTKVKYWVMDGGGLQTGNVLCQNNNCSTKALNGFYSDGTNYYEVGYGGTGEIISQGLCSALGNTTIGLSSSATCRTVGSCNDNATCGVRIPILFNNGRPSATQIFVTVTSSQSGASVSIYNDFGDNATGCFLIYTENSGSGTIAFTLTLKTSPGNEYICDSGLINLSHNNGGQPWSMLNDC